MGVLMDYNQFEIYNFYNKSALDILMYNSGHSYKKHWHYFGEIILFDSQEKSLFSVNETTYELNEGDIALIWPMQLHEAIDLDLSQTKMILFSNSFINSLFDIQRIMHLFRELNIIRKERHPGITNKLRSITDKMLSTFSSDIPNKELRCCMYLLEFMIALDSFRTEFVPEIIPYHKKKYENDVMLKMIRVTDYIKNNINAEDLSQATMANMAGISKDYFCRMFRSVTGMNYSKWLNVIRIEKAIELLADKQKVLTEIAFLSGFHSISSFNRVFKDEKGISPTQYRSLFDYDI